MWTSRTIYQVAVFWGKYSKKYDKTFGDYGGVHECKTIKEAEGKRDELLKGKLKDVHIRRIEITVVNSEVKHPAISGSRE